MTKSTASAHAIAYLRTSSAANVGGDKDSEKRQRDAVAKFAKANGYQITDEYYDAAVSGADPIDTRRGFSALLDRIEGNGVEVVIVEDASRFARDLLTQELGLLLLIKRGVAVFASNGDCLTETDDPMKKAMRQIAGVFAELEKSRLVSKLRVARERKRAAGVKVEGRKAYSETNPEAARVARELTGKGKKRKSLRAVADLMFTQGFTTSTGKPLSPEIVRRLLAAKAD